MDGKIYAPSSAEDGARRVGTEVSVNGEVREGARCKMLDDKGVRVSLNRALFKFKRGRV